MATRNKAKPAQSEAHITLYEKAFPLVKTRMKSAVRDTQQDDHQSAMAATVM